MVGELVSGFCGRRYSRIILVEVVLFGHAQLPRLPGLLVLQGKRKAGLS